MVTVTEEFLVAAEDSDLIGRSVAALPLPRLRALATHRGVETRGASRHELAQRVSADLGYNGSAERALASCGPPERALLTYLLLWGGEAPHSAATAAARRLGPPGPAAEGQAGLLDALAGAGLAFVSTPSAPPTEPPGGASQWAAPAARAVPGPSGQIVYLPLAVRHALASTVALAGASAEVPLPGSLPRSPEPALLPIAARCWQEAHARRLSAAPPRRDNPMERYSMALQGWYNVADELDSLAGPRTSQWRPLDPKIALSVAQPPVGLAPEDRRRLMVSLGCSERQLAFTLRTLRAAGLIATTPGAFHAQEHPMMEFLASSAYERLRRLTAAWLDDTSWSELFQVREMAITRSAGEVIYKQAALQAELARGRRFVVRALAYLEPGRWFSFAELLRQLHGLEPGLPALRIPAAPPAGRAARQARGSQSDWTDPPAPLPPAAWAARFGPQRRVLQPGQEDDWRALVGGFVARVMIGPLQWLGAIELALSPVHETLPDDQAIISFRLTALGHELLAPSTPLPALEPPPCPCLRLDQRLRVTPTAEAPAAVHARLRHFAVPTLTDEVTLTYSLSPRAVAQDTDSSAATSALLDLLERHHEGPLPRDAWATIKGWREHAGQVLLYPRVGVIEVADAAALDEVLATSATLRRALLCRISDTSCLVTVSAVSDLYAELTARGHTPRLRSFTP